MSDSEDLVAHMRPVLSAERDLRDLALIWQMIESSAAIGCPEEAGQILSTLTETRHRFDELQGRLIEQMVLENRAELGDDLSARAQCAIDILVRNLYERTADVGFLATDDVVRAFCAASREQRAADRSAMQQRLAEYQAKYSVYDDVLLVSPQGELLARLDSSSDLAGTRDPIVAQALAARGYIERFAATDLSADGAPALLYGHVIQSAAGAPLGVLVLRFRFADETRRIFESIVDDPHRVVVTLVDETDRVVATSDDAHIPAGAKLPPLAPGRVELSSFAGREYMASCCASQGYQGYKGPRWRAIAMVSLLTAFRQRPHGDVVDVPLDNAELNAVQGEAEAINRELRRVLWNGSVLADAAQGTTATTPGPRGDRARLKAVLRQVSVTGQRTRSRVNQAIQDIYRVAIARARHQARELARLAADVMDRNLYERANDCRWWALSPVLQRVLAEPATPANARELQSVLVYINGLYTVYSQLVAFDRTGTIRAVSVVDDVNDWVGQAAPAEWVQKLQSLSGSQSYAVTPFESTALHAHGDTYVYLAAVRHEGQLAGGIAIVFNAAREFGAMLRDIIGERSGFAAFVDANGHVLAASDPALAGGAVIDFAGDGAVVEHEGSHFACARVRAPGYREFKTSDGYDNGVSAIIGLRLGEAERRRTNLSDYDLTTSVPVAGARERCAEMAVFQLGASRYALPAEAVMMALGPETLVRTPSVGGATLGLVEVPLPGGPRLVSVLCARELFGIGDKPRKDDGVVLVLHPTAGSSGQPIGLLVDDVLTVLEVPASSMHEAPRGLQRFARSVTALIDCEASGPQGRSPVMLQALAPERLLGVPDRAEPEPEPAGAPSEPVTA